MNHTVYRSTSIGILRLTIRYSVVLSISIMPSNGSYTLSEQCVPADTAVTQIEEYLNGQRTVFEFPSLAEGTPFRRRVWEELSRIPYGEVRSYGEIAVAVGNPKAARAIGSACNKNPLPFVIPCHRIVSSDGSLTGYAGGLEIKKHLLELESATT